mgnify:CR=1 FL=1
MCVIEDVYLLVQFRCPGSNSEEEIICSFRGLGFIRIAWGEDIVDTKWTHVFGPFDLVEDVLRFLPGHLPSRKASIISEASRALTTRNRSHVDTSNIEELSSILYQSGTSCFGIANEIALAGVGTGDMKVRMSLADVLKHSELGSESLSTEVMLQAVENSLLTSLARGCLLTHGGEVEGKLGNFQAIEVERG